MKKILIIIIALFPLSSFAAQVKIKSVSDNKMCIYENPSAKVNIIGFVGGSGIKKGCGKSQNPLARDRKDFAGAGLNYYLFNNPKEDKEGLSLLYRKSSDHAERISNLIKYLKKKNNLPIILVGHSRGSVSVAAAANALGPQKIKGIVIMASLTAVNKKVTATFLMQNMLKKPTVPVLVIHHQKDSCDVTPYLPAKNLAEKMNFKLIAITGGGNTGDACGPLHHHGFEGKMPEVIQAIQKWSGELQ